MVEVGNPLGVEYLLEVRKMLDVEPFLKFERGLAAEHLRKLDGFLVQYPQQFE